MDMKCSGVLSTIVSPVTNNVTGYNASHTIETAIFFYQLLAAEDFSINCIN